MFSIQSASRRVCVCVCVCAANSATNNEVSGDVSTLELRVGLLIHRQSLIIDVRLSVVVQEECANN